MGSISSKTFVEMIEEPVTPRQTKRVLTEEFDPRSPNTQIVRTPIQVERTPEVVLDPRSPTTGIERTPIFTKQPSTTKAVTQAVVENLTTTGPACTDVPSDETADTVTPVHVVQNNLAEELAAAAMPETEAEPIIMITQKEPTPVAPPRQNAKIRVNSKSGNSPLRAVGEGQRSPLAMRNVDMSSPRVIVQRKQASKLGIRLASAPSGIKMAPRSPRQSYQALTNEDKENA